MRGKNGENRTGDDLLQEITKGKTREVLTWKMSICKTSGKKKAANIFQAFILHLTSNYCYICLALLGADIEYINN